MIRKQLHTKQEAGRLGGLATLARHGSDHFRKIGKKGAAVFWQRYHLAPAGTSGWAIVNRQTNEVKATLGSLPFVLLLVVLFLPSMACAFAAWQPYAAMKAPYPTVSPAASLAMDPQPGAAAAARSSCTVTAEALNLRAGPGTAYPVLTWLYAGQVLTVLQAGAWLQVQTDGGLTGYVNSNYCKGR